MRNVRTRARRLIACAALSIVAVAPACTSAVSAEPSAPDLAGTTRIVLRAWEDTRAGLPPLAVTRADSVSRVVAFVRSKSDGWLTSGDSLPGRALPAEFYEADRLTARFGILDREGDGGFFVSWQGNSVSLRPATEAEMGEFLAFFGISVTVVE